jgi:hypothetical protein
MPFDGQTTDHQTKPETHEREAWRRVLLDAADTLEKDGWCQGNSHEKNARPERNGRYCIYTAMGGDRIEASQKLAGHLGLAFKGFVTIWRWNDTPGRTAAEVTAALRACARS